MGLGVSGWSEVWSTLSLVLIIVAMPKKRFQSVETFWRSEANAILFLPFFHSCLHRGGSVIHGDLGMTD